jgi:hypothetical protein
MRLFRLAVLARQSCRWSSSTTNVTGGGSIRAANTVFAEGGDYTFNVSGGSLHLGAFGVTGGGAVNIVKSGGGKLALENMGTNTLVAGNTLTVNGGTASIVGRTGNTGVLAGGFSDDQQGWDAPVGCNRRACGADREYSGE